MKKLEVKKYFFLTFAPFFIPFILSIPNWLMSELMRCIIFFLLFIIDAIIIVRIYLRENRELKDQYIDKSLRLAHSNSFELTSEYRDFIMKKSENSQY